jgi:hypothetical protein
MFAWLVSHQPAVLFSLRANQPPATTTFLSEQTSTSHQPPAKRTGWTRTRLSSERIIPNWWWFRLSRAGVAVSQPIASVTFVRASRTESVSLPAPGAGNSCRKGFGDSHNCLLPVRGNVFPRSFSYLACEVRWGVWTRARNLQLCRWEFNHGRPRSYLLVGGPKSLIWLSTNCLQLYVSRLQSGNATIAWRKCYRCQPTGSPTRRCKLSVTLH